MDEATRVSQTAFSIATPAITTLLTMGENLSDTSFLKPATSFVQQGSDRTICQNERINLSDAFTSSTGYFDRPHSNDQSNELKEVAQFIENSKELNEIDPHMSSPPVGDDQELVVQDDHSPKTGKKRSKSTKKNTKLDAKSKLEKSRQSARECRARKKLRYQYLEDLVCNREKAVIKLREELSMFYELSKQVDDGTISDADRVLLTDQTKENSGTDSGGLP